MISRASDVRLPSDVDRDYTIVDLDGGVSKEQIPGASMFCLSVELLNIFYGILETIYLDSRPQTNDCSASRDADVLGKALKLNHQLDQCLTSMPGRLGDFIMNTPFTNCDTPCDFNLHEQALVTRYVISFLPELFPFSIFRNHTDINQPRFLYARVLLLRPLTTIAGNQDPLACLDLESKVLRECCSLCLQSSELLVLSLCQDESSPRRLADWHAVYCMHPPLLNMSNCSILTTASDVHGSDNFCSYDTLPDLTRH